MSQSSVIPPNTNPWAWEALRKENSTCSIWQPPGCSHSLWWALRNSGCDQWPTQYPGLRELRGIWEEWVQGAPTLASSHAQKSAKVLNLGYLLLLLAAQFCLTFCNPWTIAHQTPRSMGFSRQEYWTGLPFPSPGDLPDAAQISHTAGRFFIVWATRFSLISFLTF